MSISGSNTLNTTSLLFIDHVLAFALHLVPLASSGSGLQPQHATTSRWSSGSYEAYAPRYIYAPVVYCSTLLIKKNRPKGTLYYRHILFLLLYS